jgi:hypothetical protein
MMGKPKIDENPRPWWMDEVTEWVDKFLSERLSPLVLEFGVGNSTVWLAERCRVVGVESKSSQWLEAVREALIKRNLPGAVLWRPDEDIITGRIDLVILDGGDRVKNGLRHWPMVKPGGAMILDDSERVYKYADLLIEMAKEPKWFEVEGFWDRGIKGSQILKFRKTKVWIKGNDDVGY